MNTEESLRLRAFQYAMIELSKYFKELSQAALRQHYELRENSLGRHKEKVNRVYLSRVFTTEGPQVSTEECCCAGISHEKHFFYPDKKIFPALCSDADENESENFSTLL